MIEGILANLVEGVLRDGSGARRTDAHTKDEPSHEYPSLDITPHVDLLKALRRQNLRWSVMLGELVDNSLDSGASQVSIQLGPGRRLAVIDNGKGCPAIGPMLTLGGRHQHDTTALGRYGVGLKDVALELWGTTEIDTVHEGIRRRAIVEWSKVQLVKGRWQIPDPTEEPTTETGTRLEFRDIERSGPRPVCALVEELGFLFTPAIRAGKQITFQFGGRAVESCNPYELPPLSEVVDESFSLDGKQVSIHAGIVPRDHRNTRPGFSYVHGHRIIMTSALGSNGLSVSQVAGFVELGAGWTLTKNKTDVASQVEELEKAVFQRCESMLRKAEQQARLIESHALNVQVTLKLAAALRQLESETPEKPEPEGEGDEPADDSLDDEATDEEPREPKSGEPTERESKAPKKVGRLSVDWKWFGGRTVGEVDLTGGMVWLNTQNQFLNALRDGRNEDALVAVCLGMFLNRACSSDEEFSVLRHVDRIDFLDAWGHVLASMPSEPNNATKRPASNAGTSHHS